PPTGKSLMFSDREIDMTFRPKRQAFSENALEKNRRKTPPAEPGASHTPPPDRAFPRILQIPPD
ncbi:MAG: hypothetical protein K8R46_05250, partial [Pirellulales bacterium]|nr:hypothetical protein [Pirellulales bacterium]